MKFNLFAAGIRLLGTKDVKDLVDVGTGDQIYKEQIKSLRAKIEHKIDVLGCNVIGVTSSIAGEGKTVTTAQIAASLAQTGRKKLLLVDVDMRKADLTRGMGFHRTPGLSDHLKGERALEEVIKPSKIPGLSVVTAGSATSTPGDLLAGLHFREFLSTVRTNFDLLLLDTPPVLAVADTVTLKEFVDGFLFLYRLSFTPAIMLQSAVDEIGLQKILGIILNGAKGEKDSYYRRYYGHYYHKESTGTNA